MKFLRSQFVFHEVKERSELIFVYLKISEEFDLSNGIFGNLLSTRDKFLNYTLRDNVLPYLCYYCGKPVGFITLDTFEGKSARVHFFTFDSSRLMRIKGGREFIGRLLHMKRDGEYWLDALYGVIPKSNTMAFKYASILGLRWLIEAPALHYNNETGKSESSMVGYINREVYYEFTGQRITDFNWML